MTRNRNVEQEKIYQQYAQLGKRIDDSVTSVSVKISPPFNSFISSNKVSKLLTLLIRILINGYSRSIARNSI